MMSSLISTSQREMPNNSSSVAPDHKELRAVNVDNSYRKGSRNRKDKIYEQF
jgi:hypothetical protein